MRARLRWTQDRRLGSWRLNRGDEPVGSVWKAHRPAVGFRWRARSYADDEQRWFTRLRDAKAWLAEINDPDAGKEREHA